MAAVAGALAGILIPLIGGRLLGGSLDLLSRTFPDSRLHFDRLGAMVGEHDFGPLSQLISAALEGGLFAACVVGAIIIAERNMNSVSPRNEPR